MGIEVEIIAVSIRELIAKSLGAVGRCEGLATTHSTYATFLPELITRIKAIAEELSKISILIDIEFVESHLINAESYSEFLALLSESIECCDIVLPAVDREIDLLTRVETASDGKMNSKVLEQILLHLKGQKTVASLVASFLES